MTFEARYQSRCAACPDPIEPGDTVTYVDDELVHAHCDSEPAREDDVDEVCTACRLVHREDCF